MKRLIELLPPCPTTTAAAATTTTTRTTVSVATGTSPHRETAQTAQLLMMEKILDEERDILAMCQQYKDLSSADPTNHANNNNAAAATDDDDDDDDGSTKLLRSLSLPRPNTDISSTVLQL